MDPKTETRLSKFLSLVLRHQPERIGVTLDEAGWTHLDTLVAQARAHGTELSRETVERLVANNPKQRFAISSDSQRIRANQGEASPSCWRSTPGACKPTATSSTVPRTVSG